MPITHSLGVIDHEAPSERKTDYLYRVSLKCIIRNNDGQILVVKETGRKAWDLPGGGMDHGEDIKTSLRRELKEEVNLQGDFGFQVIHIDEPVLLENHNFWQLRLIFELVPQNTNFSPGEDGDEVTFVDPEIFKDSTATPEQKIYHYYLKLLS